MAFLKWQNQKRKAISSFFDSRNDGYNGSLNSNQGMENNYEIPIVGEFNCQKCRSNKFSLTIGFEHSVSRDEAKNIINENIFNCGAEDLFTW